MLALRCGSFILLLLTGACYASLNDSVDHTDYGSVDDDAPQVIGTLPSNPDVDQIVTTFVTTTVEPTLIETPTPFSYGLPSESTKPPKKSRKRPIKTKSGKKPLKIKMCNNDNFDGKIGYKVKQTGCIVVKATEGECKKYLWHSPVTALSMPSEWKCMLYSRENCSTKDGRMTLIEEATRNIGPHMNDRMQSFRCVQQYDDETDERAGAWMCDDTHWQGYCAGERPALGRCLNLPGKLKDRAMSFKPLRGNVCTVYEHPRCNVEKAGYSAVVEAPGASMLGRLAWRISSIRCNRQNETAGVPVDELTGSSREREYGLDELNHLIGNRRFSNDGKQPKVMTTENWDLDFTYES